MALVNILSDIFGGAAQGFGTFYGMKEKEDALAREETYKKLAEARAQAQMEESKRYHDAMIGARKYSAELGLESDKILNAGRIKVAETQAAGRKTAAIERSKRNAAVDAEKRQKADLVQTRLGIAAKAGEESIRERTYSAAQDFFNRINQYEAFASSKPKLDTKNPATAMGRLQVYAAERTSAPYDGSYRPKNEDKQMYEWWKSKGVKLYANASQDPTKYNEFAKQMMLRFYPEIRQKVLNDMKTAEIAAAGILNQLPTSQMEPEPQYQPDPEYFDRQRSIVNDSDFFDYEEQ